MEAGRGLQGRLKKSVSDLEHSLKELGLDTGRSRECREVLLGQGSPMTSRLLEELVWAGPL